MLLLMIGLGILGLLILFSVWFALTYNRFVGLNNAIESTFNQIRVAMKKRLDKIGQLVNTSKSFIKYEKSIMTDVTKLRSQPLNTVQDVQKVGKQLDSLFGSIRVAVEAYPNLKSQETVMKLMNEIDEVEDEIARIRYLYNDQVQMYNNLTMKVPTNIVASILGYHKRDYLKFGKEIEKPVDTKVF